MGYDPVYWDGSSWEALWRWNRDTGAKKAKVFKHGDEIARTPSRKLGASWKVQMSKSLKHRSSANIDDFMTKLSIIIVNWNTRDLLRQCLHSVLADADTMQPHRVETFVVDNASTDGSVQVVRAEFPWVRLIENEENVGFATANNQAIRQSCGEYLLLLNSDTEIRPGALAALVHFLDRHPAVGAAGARLLNPDGTLQISSYPAPTLLREFWRLFHLDALYPYACYRMQTWSLDTPRAVDMVQGAALVLRRKTLNQVGLLDEDYFMYTEEVDLCFRIRQAGWCIYWIPQAAIVHYGGQSTQQVAPEMFLRLYESKLLYLRKHYGHSAGRVYKAILLLASLCRISLSPLALLAQRDRRRYLMLAGNYSRLLKALPGL